MSLQQKDLRCRLIIRFPCQSSGDTRSAINILSPETPHLPHEICSAAQPCCSRCLIGTLHHTISDWTTVCHTTLITISMHLPTTPPSRATDSLCNVFRVIIWIICACEAWTAAGWGRRRCKGGCALGRWRMHWSTQCGSCWHTTTAVRAIMTAVRSAQSLKHACCSE